MSRRVVLVLVCTVVGLVGATVWVPATPCPMLGSELESAALALGRLAAGKRAQPPARSEVAETAAEYWPCDLEFRPVWRLGAPPARPPRIGSLVMVGPGWAIHWRVLLTEWGLIVLVGGSLMTVVVRRERRRRPAET